MTRTVIRETGWPSLFRAAAVSVWLAIAMSALALDAPKGKVVLTLSGGISESNAKDKTAEFDMEMLAKLPQHSFKTRTPWHDQVREYTGPRLRDVLAAVKADGKVLKAIALNDYQVEIPAEDAAKFDVIVARLADGKPMAVRDKGPLFIMYPFDTTESLQSPLYYSRAAWQLKAIEIQ